MTLPEALRKDAAARKAALNDADIAFLCLPDAAAVEAVAMIENPDTVVLDTSTAHRTDPHFVYGFPELSAEQAARIAASKRIAVPGCHASGFIAAGRAAGAAGAARAGRGAHLSLGHGLQRRRQKDDCRLRRGRPQPAL